MNGGNSDEGPTRDGSVSPSVLKLWRLTVPSRLGRPPRLTLEQVVSTALAVADDAGLTAVTLPKVARRLGVTDMALYRHIASKDELLMLLRDAGLGHPPSTAVDASSWRDGLRPWARAQWMIYRSRPWLAQIPISEPPIGPHEVAWMDAALATLTATGLGWADKLRVVGLIGGYVRSTILLDQELAAGAAASGSPGSEHDYGRALAALVDPERFPSVAQLATSGLFDRSPAPAPNPPEDDHEFLRGLDVILDGVTVMIDRTDDPPRSP